MGRSGAPERGVKPTEFSCGKQTLSYDDAGEADNKKGREGPVCSQRRMKVKDEDRLFKECCGSYGIIEERVEQSECRMDLVEVPLPAWRRNLGERSRLNHSAFNRTAQALTAALAALRMASYWGSVAISFTYSTCLTFPSLPTTNTARAVTPASGPSLINTP